MERQPETGMNASGWQPPLMAGGPLFDRSDMSPTPTGTKRQRPNHYTPIRFDLGDERGNDPGSYTQGGYLSGVPSRAAVGVIQVMGGAGSTPPNQQGVLASYCQNFGQARFIQQPPSPNTMLRRLPDSFARGSLTTRSNEPIELEQGGSSLNAGGSRAGSDDLRAIREITERLGKFADTMMQLQTSMQLRHDESCRNMEIAAKIMTDFVAAQALRSNAKEERKAKDRKLDLELRLSAGAAAVNDPHYNWLFGHGVEPRNARKKATTLQNKFTKVKNHVRANAMWYLIDATDSELSQPFIQFNDNPRTSIDGLYIKKMLMGEVGVNGLMAFALVRTMRRDENFRYPGAQGECHYVLHTWAEEVVKTGSTVDKCEEIFKQPILQYGLSACTRIVAFVSLDDGFASVSIDYKEATTLLIHPSVASAPPQEVLNARYDLMNRLTMAAHAHMIRLAEVHPPEQAWQYGVALQGGTQHYPCDIGIATAFYSIPKDHQFMPVSHDTILLAKQSFVYSLQRMCFPVTRQPIRRASRKKKSTRDALGRFTFDEGYLRVGNSQAGSTASAS